MATAAALVSIILAANGTDDFPARIGTNASALGAVAETRFEANENLLPICQTLEASEDTGKYRGSNKGFDDDDTRVIGFFLAGNTALRRLECVSILGFIDLVRSITAMLRVPYAVPCAVFCGTESGTLGQWRLEKR